MSELARPRFEFGEPTSTCGSAQRYWQESQQRRFSALFSVVKEHVASQVLAHHMLLNSAVEDARCGIVRNVVVD